jgi:hypothetical protein
MRISTFRRYRKASAGDPPTVRQSRHHPSPQFSQGGSACGGNLMTKRYFQVDAPGIDAMPAEPIAALDALKSASLALQSTHSPRYGFPSRAARDDLDSTHRSRSL